MAIFIERDKSGTPVLYRGTKGGSKQRLGKASKSDIKEYGISGEIGAVEAAKKAISGLFGSDDDTKKKPKAKSISEGLGSFMSGLTRNKGGYIGKPRTGHTDYRFNKGGMVMSSTNNMKKK
jgi:hypothetical protein